MIEGIEVLNKVPIMGLYKNSLGNITSVLFVVFLIATLVLVVLNGFNVRSSGICGIITIVLFAVSILLYTPQEKETGRYEYQCIISDEVSFVDMHEKYEIVGRDGELWTIRDK